MRHVQSARMQLTHPVDFGLLLLHCTHTRCTLHRTSQYQVHVVVRGEQTQERKQLLGAHTRGSIEEGDSVAGIAGFVQIQSA